VWVTIGLLATDGLALQLKLKRADKPRERDRILGVWCAYHPVGGALTVVRNQGSTTQAAATTSAATDTAAATPTAATNTIVAGKHSGVSSPAAAPSAVSKADSVQEAAPSSSARQRGEALSQPNHSPTQAAVPSDTSACTPGAGHQQQQQQQGQKTSKALARSQGERDGEGGDGLSGSTGVFQQQQQQQQQQQGCSRDVLCHGKEEVEVPGGAEAGVERLTLHAEDEGGEADALDLPD